MLKNKFEIGWLVKINFPDTALFMGRKDYWEGRIVGKRWTAIEDKEENVEKEYWDYYIEEQWWIDEEYIELIETGFQVKEKDNEKG